MRAMEAYRSFVLAFVFCGALGAFSAQAQSSGARFDPVTDEELRHPDPQDWLMWRRTVDSWGYSPLAQIDPGNVAQLQLAWTRGLDEGPQEGTPLVHNGVLYFPHPKDLIQAIDAATGDLLWEHRRSLPEDLEKHIFAPYINRNIAIYRDLIIDTSADGYLYALDARTGAEVWSTQVIDYKTGVHQTSGPIIADGRIISGRACDPNKAASPAPCVITAHDALTGKELWRTRTIPGPGEPGDDSWGAVPFAERKHVGSWMPPSFDPELKLIYIGTSVTSPAPKFLLGGNDKKHLYHNCTLALDVATGKIVWYYQHVVDHWDMDHPFERILIDTQVAPDKQAVTWISPDIKRGQTYKVVTGIPGKTGIVYTLDRRTGKFLWATPTVSQNIVASINPRSGAVTVDPQRLFAGAGARTFMCPGTFGGKNWPAGTYSPLTELMFFPLQNTCAEVTAVISSRKEPSAYGIRSRQQIAPGTENIGTIRAISPRTGRTEWKYEQRAATMSLLSTAGGLLFGGDMAGRFRALDQRTGATLWETNLGSQVTGFPVSFGVNGRQYVAVSTGRGVGTGSYVLLTPEIHLSNNSSLYVFTLPQGSSYATSRPVDSGRTAPPTEASRAQPAPNIATAKQCARPRPASTPRRSTLEGVYTADQSAAGRTLFESRQCIACHGPGMQGTSVGPALADPGFMAAWEGQSLGALFDCIRTTMPPGVAGTLTDAEYADVLSAILEANGQPPATDSGGLKNDTQRLNEIVLKRKP